MTTFKIAIRNIFRHKTRSIITLSTVALGCIALIFVGAFFEDLLYKLRESYIHAHTGHMQVYSKGFFEYGRSDPFGYLITEPELLTPLVQKVSGVSYVTRRLQFDGLISTGENAVSCLGQGVEPRNERMIRLADLKDPMRDVPALSGVVIETGDRLSDEDPFGAILGKGLADAIHAKVGDRLILVTRTVGGSINGLDVSVRGIFVSTSKEFDDYVLRVPLLTAQKLLRTQGVHSLIVMLKKTSDTAKVARELTESFRGRQLELKTWDELSDFYPKSEKLFRQMYLVLKVVVALVAVLSIFNTMNMAVLERTSEVGTIMALGARTNGVLLLFLCEGSALGIIGGLGGVLVGTVVTLLVRYIGIPMPPPPGSYHAWLSQPIVTPSILLFAFGLSFITATISSLYPAYKASRLEIAQALRHS